MTPAVLKALRERFCSIKNRHLERWEKQRPEPEPPPFQDVLIELQGGKFTIDFSRIIAAIDGQELSRRFIEIFDIVPSESWSAYRTKRAMWIVDRERFNEELTAAQDSFYDRVVFDHESAAILLRDFTRWRSATEKAGDDDQ